MDETDVATRGWSQKGHRCYDEKKASSKTRICFINALNQGNLIAPFLFEGSCTREIFETYLKEVLIPALKPGQVLVIDNASFHKGGNIEKLVKNAQCTLLYLPPYSPDFNPIEHSWAAIKTHIYKILAHKIVSLFDAASIALANS
jgi:transposase